MATVLVTNLAPIREPEAVFFLNLIQSFEREGHACLLWSTSYHHRLARYFVPSHWNIDNWPVYFRKAGVADAKIDSAKWQPRVARLIKQGSASPEERMRVLARYSVHVLDTIKPDLLLCWNTLCPHAGVAADVCRSRGIPVWLLERGVFPQTWYFEAGGLVGHSEIAGVELEELVPTEFRTKLARVGADYIHSAPFQTFNNYPQAPVDMDELERICATHRQRIAFFPPDDGTLGFVPVEGEDRRRTLPGYETSFDAACALARNTDAAVIFKPHPSFAGTVFDTSGIPNLYILNTDFRILMDRADAVAATGSGLATVALAMGKPHLNFARDWLCGKGISYEAQEPDAISNATKEALNRVGFSEKKQRFEVFAGYLMCEYLVSLPGASADFLKPDRAVRRCLSQVSLSCEQTFENVQPLRDELVVPALTEFLHGQEKLHSDPSAELPASTQTTWDELEATLAANPQRPRIIDFDHTLLLGNSTELFLANAGPRWLAYLVALGSDEIHRFLTGGKGGYRDHRDLVRVLSVACFLPWSLLIWKWQAKRVAAARLNRPLWDLVSGGNVHVASLGFSSIIGPLLRGLGGGIGFTASPLFRPSKNLRRVGKVEVLRERLTPEAVGSSIAVTDSHEDLPLLRAVAKPFLMKWEEPALPTPAYLPLRYTAEGKYPGKRILVTQHFGEDFWVLLLGYAWTMQSVAAVVPLFLAFFSIYEIGYFENDFHAARREKSPVLAPQHSRFANYRIGFAWLWAALFSAGGVWFLPGDYVRNLAIWAGVLVGVRLLFAAYNRTPVGGRTWIYPFLQLFKSFCLLPLVPTVIPGFLLLTSQTLRQITNYNVYRAGGDTQKFSRQTHRAIMFVVLATVVVVDAGTFEAFLIPSTALIVGWLALRISRERIGPWPVVIRRVAVGVVALWRRRDDRPRAVIFGAGIGGEKAAAVLADKWNIAAFCDNDTAKRGKNLRGVPVINPSDLGEYTDCTIHIAGFYHYHDMYTQLRRLGLPDERIRFFQLKTP